jgi:hypothetical protein
MKRIGERAVTPCHMISSPLIFSPFSIDREESGCMDYCRSVDGLEVIKNLKQTYPTSELKKVDA